MLGELLCGHAKDMPDVIRQDSSRLPTGYKKGMVQVSALSVSPLFLQPHDAGARLLFQGCGARKEVIGYARSVKSLSCAWHPFPSPLPQGVLAGWRQHGSILDPACRAGLVDE